MSISYRCMKKYATFKYNLKNNNKNGGIKKNRKNKQEKRIY